MKRRLGRPFHLETHSLIKFPTRLQYLYKVKYDDDRSIDVDMEVLYLGKIVQGDIVVELADEDPNSSEDVLVAVVGTPNDDA